MNAPRAVIRAAGRGERMRPLAAALSLAFSGAGRCSLDRAFARPRS